MTYKEMMEKALEVLKYDDELFVEMVNELDSLNGFADGFRAWSMDDIDELFCDMKISKFLSILAPGFNMNDNYMVDTIYGLDSTNDIADLYRAHVDEDELLDNIIDNRDNLYFYNDDFEELIDQIISYNEETETEAETALDSIRDHMKEGFENIAAAATADRKEGVTA